MSVTELTTSISRKASEVGISTRFLCTTFNVDRKAYARWQKGEVKKPDEISFFKLKKMHSFVDGVLFNLNDLQKSS